MTGGIGGKEGDPLAGGNALYAYPYTVFGKYQRSPYGSTLRNNSS